jgi:3',5'-cyclic AMP phosphodiesterase CpdA
MIHTGDITHLSRAAEFDNAEQVISKAKLDVHYVPGEHDVIDEDRGKAYLDRYGKNAKGAGWYSFDQAGVHFIGLVNVLDLKAGGLGNLGGEQLAWLEDDLRGKSASTPIVVFAHVPLWLVYDKWGWGTDDGLQALALLKRFGSVTILNGHIHQLVQKVEGNMTFDRRFDARTAVRSGDGHDALAPRSLRPASHPTSARARARRGGSGPHHDRQFCLHPTRTEGEDRNKSHLEE